MTRERSEEEVVWSGRFQAGAAADPCWLDGVEGSISGHGQALPVEPVPKGWSWLDSISGELDHDFMTAAETEMPEQERPGLDGFE